MRVADESLVFSACGASMDAADRLYWCLLRRRLSSDRRRLCLQSKRQCEDPLRDACWCPPLTCNAAAALQHRLSGSMRPTDKEDACESAAEVCSALLLLPIELSELQQQASSLGQLRNAAPTVNQAAADFRSLIGPSKVRHESSMQQPAAATSTNVNKMAPNRLKTGDELPQASGQICNNNNNDGQNQCTCCVGGAKQTQCNEEARAHEQTEDLSTARVTRPPQNSISQQQQQHLRASPIGNNQANYLAALIYTPISSLLVSLANLLLTLFGFKKPATSLLNERCQVDARQDTNSQALILQLRHLVRLARQWLGTSESLSSGATVELSLADCAVEPQFSLENAAPQLQMNAEVDLAEKKQQLMNFQQAPASFSVAIELPTNLTNEINQTAKKLTTTTTTTIAKPLKEDRATPTTTTTMAAKATAAATSTTAGEPSPGEQLARQAEQLSDLLLREALERARPFGAKASIPTADNLSEGQTSSEGKLCEQQQVAIEVDSFASLAKMDSSLTLSGDEQQQQQQQQQPVDEANDQAQTVEMIHSNTSQPQAEQEGETVKHQEQASIECPLSIEFDELAPLKQLDQNVEAVIEQLSEVLACEEEFMEADKSRLSISEISDYNEALEAATKVELERVNGEANLHKLSQVPEAEIDSPNSPSLVSGEMESSITQHQQPDNQLAEENEEPQLNEIDAMDARSSSGATDVGGDSTTGTEDDYCSAPASDANLRQLRLSAREEIAQVCCDERTRRSLASARRLFTDGKSPAAAAALASANRKSSAGSQVAHKRGGSLSSSSSNKHSEEDEEDNDTQVNSSDDLETSNNCHRRDEDLTQNFNEDYGTIKLVRRSGSSASSCANFRRTLVCSVSPTSQLNGSNWDVSQQQQHQHHHHHDKDESQSTLGEPLSSDDPASIYPIDCEEIDQCRAAFRENRRLIEEHQVRASSRAREAADAPAICSQKYRQLDNDEAEESNSCAGATRKSRRELLVRKCCDLSRQLPDCSRCNKRVYPVDRMELDFARSKLNIHKNCFKCQVCSSLLRLETYASVDAKLYCPAHTKSVTTTSR